MSCHWVGQFFLMDTDEILNIKFINDEMDLTLKVNEQPKEPVGSEYITIEARENNDNLDEEASFHPKHFPRKEVENSVDRSKDSVAAAIDDEGNQKQILRYYDIVNRHRILLMKKIIRHGQKIYREIHETYFKEVTLFPGEFLEQCKIIRMYQHNPI